jgi:hypothetical protein
MIKNFNNKTDKVGDDFKNNIIRGSKVSVAAAIFSIYGYESLKKELNKIDELKFIFTDPTFVEVDKEKREKKLFEINSCSRQKAINGSDFEINLKNELRGKAIAKECKKWIENKVSFKLNNSIFSSFCRSQLPSRNSVGETPNLFLKAFVNDEGVS